MTRKSRIRTFCRKEHLKGRSEIREVFDKGKRYFTPGVRLFVLENDLPHNRICFTFAGSRKFGNAVARNRAKRFYREAYRLLKEQLAGGYDFILMIYSNPGELTRTADSVRTEDSQTLSGRMEQLQSLYKKAGLIRL